MNRHMGMRISAGDDSSGEMKLDISDVFKLLLKERTVFLAQEVNADLASYVVANLFYMEHLSKEKEITIYINSTGGSVQDGLFTIYDCMRVISPPIRTVCIGEAYSSAAVILSAGTKGRRFATPNSKMMIHSIQIEDISGTLSEVEQESKLTKEMNGKLMNIIAQHTGQNIKKVKRDCQKDKYFSAEEAIKYGLIDAVLEPSK